MRRLGAAVACALGALAVLAPLAAAHTGGAGTDYASRIASTPPGIEARMIGGDDRIELRRTGDATYVVVGYVDEPFLKLAPDGIYENAASISVPLSADRLPDQATARALDARAPEAPRWRRISTGSTIAYHDHRAHWMSETPPAIVRAQPGTTRMLFDWSIPIEVDGVRDRIRGQVGYVAPPRATAWWVALALALAAAAALALRLAPARCAQAGSAVAVALALAVAAAAAWDEPGRAGAVASACASSAVVALAALAAARATRRTPAIAAAALVAGALLAVLLALGDRIAPSFAYGVLPSALPEVAVRVLIIAALVALAGAVVAAGRLLAAAATVGAGPQRVSAPPAP